MKRFFKEHFKLTVVLSIVLVMLIVMTVSYFFAPGDFILNDVTQTVISTIQTPFTKVGDGVAGGLQGVFGFKKVLRENEQMKQQIADLNKEVINIKLSQNELEELRSLSNALNYLNTVPEYEYVTGEVIAQSGDNWLTTFTVNLGEKHGIAKDDIVINGDGLIGRVAAVGTGWAKVITIIDDSSAVSFRIARNIQNTGMLSGDGEGKLEGYLLDTEAEIVAGDILITSGLGIYPQGIAIGKVEDVVSDDNKLLKTIKIKQNVNLNSLQKVTIIKTR